MKKHIKCFISGFLIALVLLVGVTAIASPTRRTLEVFTGYNLFVDGVRLVDERGRIVEPFGLDGNLYVPAEEIARAFGKGVNWQPSTQSLWLGHVPAGMIPIEPPRPRETVRLSDLDYFASEHVNGHLIGNWIYFEEHRMNTGNFTRDSFWAGSRNVNAISSSTRDYLLKGEYTSFQGTVYIDYDYRSATGLGNLIVWGDGRQLYKSPDITSGTLPFTFDIIVSGVEVLKIRFEVTGFHFGISNAVLLR